MEYQNYRIAQPKENKQRRTDTIMEIIILNVNRMYYPIKGSEDDKTG